MVYLQRWQGWCPWNCCSRRVLCAPYNHALCYFIQSHIRKVYACLAVTCHLHFWQNDQNLLRATAVTRGCNGYRNKSQHRKLTLEKKILPPLLQGFEPATFQSRVRRSNHSAIPAPVPSCKVNVWCCLNIPIELCYLFINLFTCNNLIILSLFTFCYCRVRIKDCAIF